MTTLARRKERSTNTWPGFVDALAALLMVLMFIVMVFVVAQFFLGQAISGRDEALEAASSQLDELADLLAIERKSNKDLRASLTQLSDELRTSIQSRDTLSTALRDANGQIEALEGKLEAQGTELATLSNEVAALQALKEELEAEIAKLGQSVEEKDQALIAEKELSESNRAKLALANKQLETIKKQLAGIEEALEISERKNKEANAQIKALGKRLNAALATKVQELAKYRSEFFGRLRDVLGNSRDIRIVGDRFVFQSEVLFQSGSADLGAGGKKQMANLAKSLLELSKKIPDDIDWILRVDGHTDSIPIFNEKFRSNWELSSARAISVVKFLIAQGISPQNLVAAGFGEFQPIDNRSDEIALRRNRRIELKLTQR